MGAAARSSASGSPTSSSRCCCAARTPSATRTTPTTSSRPSSRSRPQAGIDLFRIFDSLNWVAEHGASPSRPCVETGTLCEAAICYTGDILDPSADQVRPRSTTSTLAKELEKRGRQPPRRSRTWPACCKPYAADDAGQGARARRSASRSTSTPTTPAASQAASVLRGRRRRASTSPTRAIALDVRHDLPAEPQRARRGAAVHRRATPASTSTRSIELSRLLGGGPRRSTPPFETGLQAPAADVYHHEMPGGQYTNLYQQATALGLADALARGLHRPTPRSTSCSATSSR